jgi:hypothetical protein
MEAQHISVELPSRQRIQQTAVHYLSRSIPAAVRYEHCRRRSRSRGADGGHQCELRPRGTFQLPCRGGGAVSALTAIVVVVIVYGLLNSYGYGRALALGGATSAGAFLTVGSTSIPTFYVVALGGILLLAIHSLIVPRQRELVPVRRIPGVPMLAVFLAWSTLVTLISPLVFDGATLVSPTATHLVAGVITDSNVAQVTYLAIGIGVVVLLARSRRAGPEIIGLSLWVAIALSFWRYFYTTVGLPFPDGLFDNSAGFAYIETAAGGAVRFRGIFSEPSALAGSAIIAMAYGFSRAVHLQGLRKLGPLVLVGISIFLGFVSTSTTFLVAGVALIAIVGLTFGLGFLARRTRFSVGVTVLGCVLAIAALWLLPAVGEFVGTALGEKVSSPSYSERSSADSDSYRVFIDSWGIGVGLGAGRASSILPTILSTTGLVGTLLFTGAIVGVAARSFALHRLRPVLWGLIALFVVKLIAGPDPFDSTGLLWMSLGVLAHGILAENRLRRGDQLEGRNDSRPWRFRTGRRRGGGPGVTATEASG